MGGWSNTNKQRNIRRMDKYKDGDTIFILMTAEQCKSVMREWLEHNYECDLNVMRLSLIHITEPTRLLGLSRMPSSA